ncbi:AAA family ATPase [Lachnospiraceae bacterium 54-53]
MIISFRFKNFRSFPDETFMDMKAVNYNEHPGHLFSSGSQELLKTLAVYGNGASGKTNLFLALASFHSFVFWQLFSLKTFPQNHFMSLLKLRKMNRIIPFQANGAGLRPTEMELSFLSGGRVYEFGFTVCGQEILSEYLNADHHVVYMRTARELSIGPRYEKTLCQKVNLRPHDSRLFCCALSYLDIPEIREIMGPFESFFSGQILYHFDILESFRVLENTGDEESIYKLLENPDALGFGLEQLRKIGIPAEDFLIERGIPMLGYRIKSRTTGQYQIQYMDFTEVSAGTVKYLSLFIKIYELQQRGGVLVLDNISSEFQTSVMKSVVDFFQQENGKNMQLIFSTCDSSVLNDRQFRRDEVAFVDMNEYQESRLYTMADIRLKSEAGFPGNYFLEKYGTVPLVKDYC